MSPFIRPRPGVLATAVLLTAALAACEDSEDSPLAPISPDLSFVHAGARAFEVYTQNLYLGGDTGPLFTLDFTDIPAVIAAANVFWAEVLASDVSARTAEIVDEIEGRRPHAVALQEVLNFVVLDGTFTPIQQLDLLGAVEAEITARGLPYVVEATRETTSSTLPLAFDRGTGGISEWLSFTDRVVTLRRTDTEAVGVDTGVYAAAVDLGALVIRRGWARVTLRHRGTTYQVVNTHLEVQPLAPVQAAQAAELRDAVLADLDGVTVLAGDLNSNAAAEPGDPTWTPTYESLIDAGFTDVWTAQPRRRRGPGLTCCHPASLLGDQAFTQRIDFILVRPEDHGRRRHGVRRGVYRAEIVGEEARDRTPEGLWPSDHAGLFGQVRLPPHHR